MTRQSHTRLDRLAERLRSVRAGDIMTRDVVTTKEDATLEEVANIMVKKRISGLPVVRKRGKVVGMITETDLFIVMDMIESGDVLEDDTKRGFNPTVKFAMSTEVFKVKENSSLDEIISLVKYRNVHTIPVFSGKKMVGIIGRQDIFRHFYNIVRGI